MKGDTMKFLEGWEEEGWVREREGRNTHKKKPQRNLRDVIIKLLKIKD